MTNRLKDISNNSLPSNHEKRPRKPTQQPHCNKHMQIYRRRRPSRAATENNNGRIIGIPTPNPVGDRSPDERREAHGNQNTGVDDIEDLGGGVELCRDLWCCW